MSALEIKNQQQLQEWSPSIFTPEALSFMERIIARFAARRDTLLEARKEAQHLFNGGTRPNFLSETREIRESEWQVAPPPAALLDRRVEITAPAERKMIILALNSPAKAFMADLEDSLSPSWENVARGQQALYDAAHGKCELKDEKRGKHYQLDPQHSCHLIVRPRGWHLPEKNILYNGHPAPASLVDFSLFFFHNARILSDKDRGPYFYLPKVEHWREAALWNEVMDFAEQEAGLTNGITRATLLIETLPAVFQMHEILHAMRGRLVGLNCGRWDYIFSYIKTLSHHAKHVLPERAQVTMACPFLSAYSHELISVCHQRGAHAMGGMSAFIPIRGDEAENNAALAKVREDKELEAANGHDGTWVAHPDLIKVAEEVFNRVMPQANQKNVRPEGRRTTENLLEPLAGNVTVEGFDSNIQVALRYLSAWLSGSGAVPIFNMMEDAATAEISRTQLWQWLRYPTKLSDGRDIKGSLFANRLQAAVNDIGNSGEHPKLSVAADLLESLVTKPDLEDFLTLPAYSLID